MHCDWVQGHLEVCEVATEGMVKLLFNQKMRSTGSAALQVCD